MQLNLFTDYGRIDKDILTEQLFEAYYECRKNKRNTLSALEFEKNLERELFKLRDEIIDGTYRISKSIVFMVTQPVKREIFAASFRDRIVHHFVIAKINPLFESLFSDNCFACRVGKGTHYGINYISEALSTCTQNYTHDAWVMKLDIKGFFMHINKKILYDNLSAYLNKRYVYADFKLILSLCEQIILYDPSRNFILKGDPQLWKNFPSNKSLFGSPEGTGLPIGNLTSQIFANFYLDQFDKYVINALSLKYYGRYVDDFVIISRSKNELVWAKIKIQNYLAKELKLELHPKKVYLQHYSKGIPFLGCIIKPGRLYLAKRTKSQFYDAIHSYNSNARKIAPDNEERNRFLSSMNSYLGLMIHYKTYRLRKKALNHRISAYWCNIFYPSNNYSKLTKRVRRVKSKDKRLGIYL